MKRALLSFAALAAVAAASPAMADEALAKAKNCMACHTVDKKLYRDVATKYAADRAAVQKLSAKIRNGGVGVWGQIPMPANPQVSEAEAGRLAAWVLGQR